MASASLQPLTCSNCGAHLTAEPEGAVIRCAYCQTEHAFVAQAPPPAREPKAHVAGDAVLVQWGGRWWNGHVVDAVGASAWKIHYDGWSDRWDEIVSADRIAATTIAASPPARAGRHRWWLGAGLGLVAVLLAIRIVTSSSTRPEPPAEPVAPPGTPIEEPAALREGDPVWGYSIGQWWPAEIVRRTDSGRYEVRYVGYESKWNESLAVDQLRHRR